MGGDIVRRNFAIATAIALICLGAPVARAADLPAARDPVVVAAPQDPYALSNGLFNPTRFELRGGVFAHGIGSIEKGSADLNAEIVFPKFYTVPGWVDVLIPRLHAGGMVNFSGKTDYAYAGALWTVNFFERWFAEAFFGASLHNGFENGAPGRIAQSCRLGFHAGASLGYRFDQHWSIMGTYDHLSNGRDAFGTNCASNPGLNEYGLRVGYAF